MALNVKQEAFCLHYARTGNATESYKKAGYAPKTERSVYASSNQLLKNPKVQARLKELADELASDKIASVREIQEYLTSVLRGTSQAEEIVVEGSGNGYSRARAVLKKPSEKERLKAAETLAKMQGGFDTKMQVELTIPVFGGEEEFEAEED